MEKPRYQIFISSTYEDMKEERQAAMMAILEKKHIPAGMEYFSARYLSQFDVIKEWMESCDIFLLILGGRYGSICDQTKKSFVHMEFEYAQILGMPIIVLMADQQYVLRKKAKAYKNGNMVYEGDRTDLYDNLTGQIRKMRKTYDSIGSLKLEIIHAIDDIERDEKAVSMLNGLVPCHCEMGKNKNEVVIPKGILKELLLCFFHSAVFSPYSEKMYTGRGYHISDKGNLATGQFDYYNYEEFQVEYQRLRIWSHAVEEKRYVEYIAGRRGNSDYLEETLRFRFQGYPDSFRFTSRQAVRMTDKDCCATDVKEMSIRYLGVTVDAVIDETGMIKENTGEEEIRQENDQLTFEIDDGRYPKMLVVRNSTPYVKYIVVCGDTAETVIVKILPGDYWEESVHSRHRYHECDSYEEAEEYASKWIEKL